MRFIDIYNRIVNHWPEEVLISDGHPTTKEAGHDLTPSNSPLGDDGYYFPTLSENWGQVEEKVGPKDTWGDMMVWTMFQIFHSKSKELLQAGAVHLKTREVSMAVIEKQYYLNLQSEGWEEERDTYERS